MSREVVPMLPSHDIVPPVSGDKRYKSQKLLSFLSFITNCDSVLRPARIVICQHSCIDFLWYLLPRIKQNIVCITESREELILYYERCGVAVCRIVHRNVMRKINILIITLYFTRSYIKRKWENGHTMAPAWVKKMDTQSRRCVDYSLILYSILIGTWT